MTLIHVFSLNSLFNADGKLAKHLHQLRHFEHESALDEILEVGVDAGANSGVQGVPRVFLDVDVIAD